MQRTDPGAVWPRSQPGNESRRGGGDALAGLWAKGTRQRLVGARAVRRAVRQVATVPIGIAKDKRLAWGGFLDLTTQRDKELGRNRDEGEIAERPGINAQSAGNAARSRGRAVSAASIASPCARVTAIRCLAGETSVAPGSGTGGSLTARIRS